MLRVEDLRVGFAAGGKTLLAVNGISFALAAGETFALLGESGCGKSATAQALMRLLPAAGRIVGGQVLVDGVDVLALSEAAMRQQRGRRMAMIFQEPATSLNPVLTVGQQIGEVLQRHLGLVSDAARRRMLELLQQVGIADGERRLGEFPFQLSGGMKQRVMIAMALAGEPEVLIADEPTTALDVTVQAQILDLLAELQQKRGMAILLITHDLGVVARMAHHVGVMYAGELVEVASREQFFTRPVHPYTRALFAALPDVSRRGMALQTIPGQVPSLAAMPQACRFAPRCVEVMVVCHAVVPGWRSGLGGQQVRCHWQAPEVGSAIVETGVVVADQSSQPGLSSLLDVKNLKVHFPIRRGLLQRTVGQVRAVDGIDLQIAAGRTLALVGESGCGKTTAGKAILQLQAASGGVRLGVVDLNGLSGQKLRQQRRRMQMIFQDPFASLNPRLRIGEIIAEGMQALDSSTGTSGSAVSKLLQQVGLDDEAATRYPHEFSGGQRQRIAIARALAVQPELLICDEPTSALDVSVQAQILNLLKLLQDDLGVAYLFITHNFAVVEYLAHEVAVMYLGRIVERGRTTEVLAAPRHPYTQALLSAVPVARLGGQGAVIRLAGEAPSPANPPAGCYFHPRCAMAMERCQQEYPATHALGNEHLVSCHLYGEGNAAPR